MLAWVVVVGSSASAQNYSLNWHSIGAGGGVSAGSRFTVRGTIGQPDVGAPVLTGDNYSLTGGFWSVVGSLSLNLPKLAIASAGPGLASISWTPDPPGFLLQESSDLQPPNWLNAPSGTNNPVTVPASAASRFYRLFKP